MGQKESQRKEASLRESPRERGRGRGGRGDREHGTRERDSGDRDWSPERTTTRRAPHSDQSAMTDGHGGWRASRQDTRDRRDTDEGLGRGSIMSQGGPRDRGDGGRGEPKFRDWSRLSRRQEPPRGGWTEESLPRNPRDGGPPVAAVQVCASGVVYGLFLVRVRVAVWPAGLYVYMHVYVCGRLHAYRSAKRE